MRGRNATIIFQESGEVIVESRSIPQPKREEFLIKTRKTLISTGTELSHFSRNFPPDSVWARIGKKFPHISGYSNIGEIIDVGDGVEREWIGRRVCTYRGGFHAQYIIGTRHTSCVVPKEIPDEEATFFVLARTAMNGVRRAKVQLGESVAVYGLGILGQLTVRFCYLVGGRPIIGVDIAESRLAYLPDLPGVIIGINPKDKDFVSYVKDLTRERLVTVLFEVTGNPDVIPQEFEILRPQGRLIMLSSPLGKTTFDFHDLCNWPSYSIIGAHYFSHPEVPTEDNPWTEERNSELFFDLIKNSELDVGSLISHRKSYQKAPEVYRMLLKNRSQAMGVVLTW